MAALIIFTHFIAHFFKGLYLEKTILLIQNFIRAQGWDICKHLPKLQWMAFTANDCQYRTDSVLMPVAFYEKTLEIDVFGLVFS